MTMNIHRFSKGLFVTFLVVVGVVVGPPNSWVTRTISANTPIQFGPSGRVQRDTVGADRCEQCHQAQMDWWFSDKHFTTAEPFFSEQTKYVKVARLYGLMTSEMVSGDSDCVACHGTVVSEEFSSGVSCESCHGPASDYLEPHSSDSQAIGTEESSYQEALGLGMIELRNVARRAETCASCHLIDDPRLISVGHPRGMNFDLYAASTKIKHWEHPVAAANELQAAFRKITGLRGFQQVRVQVIGPIPRASRPIREFAQDSETRDGGPLIATVPPEATQQNSSQISSIQRTRATEERILPIAGRVRPPDSSARVLELPPFPEITEETSAEEILLIVQERLKLLHQKLYTDQPNQRKD